MGRVFTHNTERLSGHLEKTVSSLKTLDHESTTRDLAFPADFYFGKSRIKCTFKYFQGKFICKMTSVKSSHA